MASVSLIYGEAETGKSTLAMQCAVNCARQGYKTLFVDCDGTFSAERLDQIASGDFGKIAELITVMKPNNFQEQAIVTDRLADYINKNVGLIAVDTVTSLYRERIAETPAKTFELNRELNRQLASVAQTAKIQKVAVLMVSQVHAVFKEEQINIEPVATRVLKFWADVIINMKPTENPRIIRAIVEKTFGKSQSSIVYLKIEKHGMHEYQAR